MNHERTRSSFYFKFRWSERIAMKHGYLLPLRKSNRHPLWGMDDQIIFLFLLGFKSAAFGFRKSLKSDALPMSHHASVYFHISPFLAHYLQSKKLVWACLVWVLSKKLEWNVKKIVEFNLSIWKYYPDVKNHTLLASLFLNQGQCA